MKPPPQTVTPEQLALRPGDVVEVVLDSGVRKRAQVSVAPWQIRGKWQVCLAGRSGGFDLERVKKLETRPTERTES